MKRVQFAVILGALAMTTTACAGGADNSAGGTRDEMTTLRVGVLPTVSVAPLYLGIEEGFFAEEGLELEPVTSQGGASIVPSVVSGEFDFGYGNVVSLMQARDQGLNLQIISGGAQAASSNTKNVINALLVAPDSGIDSVNDVAGKTVAVTTLNNLGDLTTRAALESEGVDHSDVEFVEMGFPDMNQAVLLGNVDVAWQAEPFVTMGKEEGLVSLMDPMFATMPGVDNAVYFGLEDYLDQNSEEREAFQRALDKSMNHARENTDAARKIVQTYTEIPQDVAETMGLPQFSPTVNMDSINLQAELALEYGMVSNEIDIDSLLAPGANDEG